MFVSVSPNIVEAEWRRNKKKKKKKKKKNQKKKTSAEKIRKLVLRTGCLIISDYVKIIHMQLHLIPTVAHNACTQRLKNNTCSTRRLHKHVPVHNFNFRYYKCAFERPLTLKATCYKRSHLPGVNAYISIELNSITRELTF